MLSEKTVLLGVSGSIAAYKAAGLASALSKLRADVHVLMTKNALNFINPITFETLTGNKCLVDTFDRNFKYNVEHVALAKKADVAIVAPATANVIGKLAHGIADDMLTTTLLACKCRKIISPAMNTNMYENPIVMDNMDKLKNFGMRVVEPDEGRLACGDVGAGKMPSEDDLLEYVLMEIGEKKDLLGKKVLVTAGPTVEPIDPVRFISNRSTGKMGYAAAKAAARRGADVTLISGPSALPSPKLVDTIRVQSADEMFDAAVRHFEGVDIIVMAAAVADYSPADVAVEKIKKSGGDVDLRLKRTRDILKYMGEHKEEGTFLCGFSMETENVIENSKRKLVEKKADMIVANSLKEEGAGFGTDTNKVAFITSDGVSELPCMGKDDAADEIFDEIIRRRG